jgi:hypothetical protein
LQDISTAWKPIGTPTLTFIQLAVVHAQFEILHPFIDVAALAG